MVPRLVATDLDGTLVRKDGTVSPYTRSVLGELEARGVPVIFVTGRPLRWTEEVFPHVGSHGLAIVSNGALVWDVAASLPRLQRAMSVDCIAEVARRIREVVPGTVFAVEQLAGFGNEPGYVRRDAEVARNVGPLDELLDEPVFKLLARAGDVEPEAYWHAVERVVGDLAVVTWTGFAPVPLLEISAPGVTKASTLAMICEQLGVAAHEVIAFGDMPNDVPMLSWAGTSYAMADAHPLVVSCSHHVAPSHEEDGVARVLAEVYDL